MSVASEPVDAPAVVPAPARTRPRFRPARRRRVGRLVAVAIAALGAAGAAWLRARPVPVTVAAVVRGRAVDAVYATATVEAKDRVTVKARLPGAIVGLRVHEGDAVTKGELLAVIDSASIKFQLQKGKVEEWAASQEASSASPRIAVAEGHVMMSEASLRNAREDLARLGSLVASGASPPSELDRATNSVAVLEAQLASQRAEVRALRIDLAARSSSAGAAVSELAAKLADAEVRAPIDGVVLASRVELGELAPPDGILFRLGDVRTLILECSVDEADIGRVAVGERAAVSLYAFPGRALRGAVYAVLPDADRVRRSFLVKVRLEDAPRELRSGMSGEVNIVVDEHPLALLAPSEAVDAAGAVWVVRGDRVERREVVVGVRDMARVEIVAGLSDGDRVVVSAPSELRADSKVRATPRTSNAPEPAASAAGAP